MKLAGVIVVYNPTDNINDNIKSYLDYVKKIYVVDNSNSDNSNKIIKDKKIEYIPNHKNLGIAKALNIAAQKAYDEKFDFLLTMDQDSKFEDDNLEKLIKYVEKCDINKVGLVSPWHVTKEENAIPKEDIEEVVEVMTSGNLVNLKLWKKINGWKDYFFIDNVDIEYCMNLNKHGYKVIRYNKSKLIHNLGNIRKRRFLWKTYYCSNHNYIRQYYMIRNLYYLEDLYKNDFPENIKKMKRGARGRFKYIIFGEKDKYRKIRNMYRGYKDYKKGITGEYPYKN
jgi:rhamnosyltransferase